MERWLIETGEQHELALVGGSTTRPSLLTEALRLPVEERAKLITEVIAMVDDAAAEDPTEVEHAWDAELELRIARADANPSEGIDWADLRAQLVAK